MPVGGKMEVEEAAQLRQLYGVMRQAENNVGGGEGVQGLYGSITQGGCTKIFSYLRDHCELGPSSTLVDIGAGLGRPLLQGMIQAKVEAAFGVEVDEIKCQKAAAFLRACVQKLTARELLPEDSFTPTITHSPIEQVSSLEPATHAYSFWEGVPETARRAFGVLFRRSATLQCVAVVQRALHRQLPEIYMGDLGFGPLELVRQTAVTMSGSGRSFQAYIFKKVHAKQTLERYIHTSPAHPSDAAVTDTDQQPQLLQLSQEEAAGGATAQRAGGDASGVEEPGEGRGQTEVKVQAVKEEGADEHLKLRAAAGDIAGKSGHIENLLQARSRKPLRCLESGRRAGMHGKAAGSRAASSSGGGVGPLRARPGAAPDCAATGVKENRPPVPACGSSGRAAPSASDEVQKTSARLRPRRACRKAAVAGGAASAASAPPSPPALVCPWTEFALLNGRSALPAS